MILTNASGTSLDVVETCFHKVTVGILSEISFAWYVSHAKISRMLSKPVYGKLWQNNISCKVGTWETTNQLPEKPFMKDDGLPIASFYFRPYGGYPLELLEWFYDLVALY
jgi:hypothetical protein